MYIILFVCSFWWLWGRWNGLGRQGQHGYIHWFRLDPLAHPLPFPQDLPPPAPWINPLCTLPDMHKAMFITAGGPDNDRVLQESDVHMARLNIHHYKCEKKSGEPIRVWSQKQGILRVLLPKLLCSGHWERFNWGSWQDTPNLQECLYLLFRIACIIWHVYCMHKVI